jgi:hypothetical protein
LKYSVALPFGHPEGTEPEQHVSSTPRGLEEAGTQFSLKQAAARALYGQRCEARKAARRGLNRYLEPEVRVEFEVVFTVPTICQFSILALSSPISITSSI